MKKHNFIFKIILFSLIFNISVPLFSEEGTSKKSDKEDVPIVLQDLRRFEIITLGSLPFVFLDSTLVYSGIRYFNNGMDKKYIPSIAPELDKDEQTGVLLTSLGISLGIGITDLIVNIVKRSKKNKRNQIKNNSIIVNPISEDPEAIKLSNPNNDTTTASKNAEIEQKEEKEEDVVIEINEDDN